MTTANHPSSRRRSFPLALVLFAVLTALVMGVAGIVIFESYRRSAEVGTAAGRREFANLRTEVAVQQQQLAEPLRFLVDLLTEDPLLGEGRAGELQSALLTAMTRYPQMAEVRIGYDDGELFAVTSLSGGGSLLKDAFAAPEDARFAARRFTRVDGDAGARWRVAWLFLGEDGRLLHDMTVPVGAPTFMHEPWFAGAGARPGDVVQTKAAVIPSLRVAGLSFAKRFGGERPGVAAADVSLGDLSLMLSFLQSSEADFITLFDGDGLLLAYPDANMVVDAGGGALNLGRFADIGIPVAYAMMERFRAEGTFSLAAIEAAGTRFLASITRVGNDDTAPIYLALALPEATFTGIFLDISREAVLISLAVLVLTAPVIVWVAGRISRPLARLEAATERIASLALDTPAAVPSRIREIGRLGGSIERMRNALGQVAKFVPKTVVQDLIRSGAALEVGGERSALSFLFTDVRDFTPLAESLAPEELMAEMSRYFAGLVDAVLTHKGTVDKFVGDALFAFWNAPLRQEDHAARACRAALAARETAACFNADLAAAGRRTWHTRFGLHTGEAVVGNVGSSDRLDYTAIGSAVNLAARLEGLNKFYGTQIIASGDLAARVKGGFVFRPVDKVQAKGAGSALDIFELMAAQGDAAATAQAAAWEAVYALYAARDWAAALKAAENFLARYPDDGLALAFRERLRGFAQAPPPADWDGVTKYDIK